MFFSLGLSLVWYCVGLFELAFHDVLVRVVCFRLGQVNMVESKFFLFTHTIGFTVSYCVVHQAHDESILRPASPCLLATSR